MKNYKLKFTDTFDFSNLEKIKKLSKEEFNEIKKDLNKVVFKNWKLQSIEKN